MKKNIYNLLYRISSALYRYFTPPRTYAIFLGVKIGKNCSIATKGFPREAYLISIGNNVQVTEGVKFFTHGGGWVIRNKYPDYDSFGKIRIGNNVYIGNDVCIMPGVTIGNNVVIGASSIVTKSIPSNVVVAGNPAKIIKSYDEYITGSLPFNLHCKGMGYNEKKKFLLSLDESKFIKK